MNIKDEFFDKATPITITNYDLMDSHVLLKKNIKLSKIVMPQQVEHTFYRFDQKLSFL